MKQLRVSSNEIDKTVALEYQGDSECFEAPSSLDDLVRIVHRAFVFGNNGGFCEGHDDARRYYENRQEYEAPVIEYEDYDDVDDVKRVSFGGMVIKRRSRRALVLRYCGLLILFSSATRITASVQEEP